MEQITKDNVKDLNQELQAVLREFGKKHGIDIKTGTFRYSSTEFSIKVEGALQAVKSEDADLDGVNSTLVAALKRRINGDKAFKKVFSFGRHGEKMIVGFQGRTKVVVRDLASRSLRVINIDDCNHYLQAQHGISIY